MKRILLILLTVFVLNNLAAQQKSIRGKVLDTLTLEPLESAMIMSNAGGCKTATDKNGNFILQNAPGDSLIISYIGYEPKKIKADFIKPVLIKLQRGIIQLKDITVSNNLTFDTYKVLSNLDLNMQPVKSAQDLLRLVPGLFIAQHMGGGKAEQIFLRGFDADHGTDVNITADGLPVNMVTHAHGQGYADMHFLIPETVSSYDFGKGPYYPDKGDFTTAGYVAYNTKSILSQDMIKIEAGQYHTYRAIALINLLSDKEKEKGQSAYIAAEGLFSDGGPFLLPEHFTRYNLFGKFNTKLGDKNKLTVIVSTFKSDWRASGEIPDRAVTEGYIPNRFGVLDKAQGGHTARTNASIKLVTHLSNNWIMENQLWYANYYFNLVSNFTFLYYFPSTGDEFRQKERRNLDGYNGKLTKTTMVGNSSFTTTIGADTRYDDISPVELDHTEEGRFLSYLQYGKAKELNANAYFDESVCTGKWLFDAGVRLDYFHFYYLNMLPATDSLTSALFNHTNTDAHKAVISPKINLEYTFSDCLQLYLKAGKGLHSNDARVVIANKGFDVLPAAYGSDLGINWKPIPALFLNSAVWYLYLQQEFTYGQDLLDQAAGGPVTPGGKTSRVGIDFSARYQVNSWLYANLNANFARPRFIDSVKGHDYVPLAPTFTSTAGLDFRLKNGINGGLSYRYLHDRAANSVYSLNARGYFITDLAVNYTQKRYELGISIENLLDRRWDESQFEYISRLKGEASPVDQVSYTPGTPFFTKLKLAIFF